MNILNEAAQKIEADTTVYRDKIYPLVEEVMSKQSTRRAYKDLIGNFISARTEGLYDILPCSRLICSESEMDKLFDAIGIKKSKISELLKETYYADIPNFSPLSAKHEFTVLQLNIVRYFICQNLRSETELSMLYLSFSGKFYPSLHYRSYPIVPVRYVMEYVVNNKLSKKFDLVVYGNVIGAIRSVGNTWVSTYKDKFKSFTDEDGKYLIDQLYSRIGSFMKNIAREYYDAYDDKDSFISYSTDSYNPDDYHIAESNTLKVSKCIEKAVNSITSTGIDYKICKMCSDTNITPNECKAVIESIVQEKENILEIKELISLMVSLYFASGESDVTDIKFITYTIAPKPNAKQKEIIRMKEIIEGWLSESGTAYLRRRSRVATRNSYERAVRMYFALVIHNANR